MCTHMVFQLVPTNSYGVAFDVCGAPTKTCWGQHQKFISQRCWIRWSSSRMAVRQPGVLKKLGGFWKTNAKIWEKRKKCHDVNNIVYLQFISKHYLYIYIVAFIYASGCSFWSIWEGFSRCLIHDVYLCVYSSVAIVAILTRHVYQYFVLHSWTSNTCIAGNRQAWESFFL